LIFNRVAIFITKVHSLLFTDYLLTNIYSAFVMRLKDNQEQLAYLKHASELGHLELLYAGLDVLGNTPWKINRDVFDIVLSVWNSGERLGKIPPAVYDAPEPERLTPEQEGDIKAKSVHILKQKAWLQAKANNHSERCSVNYKVEIARAVSALYVSYLLVRRDLTPISVSR
jgi:DNA-directed RNA polymerase